jgi:hypothetical protein
MGVEECCGKDSAHTKQIGANHESTVFIYKAQDMILDLESKILE